VVLGGQLAVRLRLSNVPEPEPLGSGAGGFALAGVWLSLADPSGATRVEPVAPRSVAPDGSGGVWVSLAVAPVSDVVGVWTVTTAAARDDGGNLTASAAVEVYQIPEPQVRMPLFSRRLWPQRGQ
jgi:hypothetical protein